MLRVIFTFGLVVAAAGLTAFAEVSLDHAQWTEVGRRVEEFSEWSLKIPPRKARYVRLRIARPSTFHLKDVVIR